LSDIFRDHNCSFQRVVAFIYRRLVCLFVCLKTPVVLIHHTWLLVSSNEYHYSFLAVHDTKHQAEPRDQ